MNLDPRFFLSDEVHPRSVKLPDGTELEMHFRELSRADVRTLADKDINGSDMADRMLQACLCDEGGQPLLSLEQVLSLRPAFFNAISEHVMKVNGIGEEREQAKALAAKDERWFLHVLALALGRTVWELEYGPHRLTQKEFTAWAEFHRINRLDDMYRLYRPAALIAHAMGGAEMDALLNWLQPPAVEPLDEAPGGLTHADLNTLAAFRLKPKRKEN